LLFRYRRIFAEAGTKLVPVIVVDTVVLTVPLVGDMPVTVAAEALLTVNVPDTVPPPEFRITRFQVPGATPFRLKILLMAVVVSVPTTAPVMVLWPVFVRVTADPLKPVPVISMVCDPLLTAPEGDMPVMVGFDDASVASAVKVTEVRPALDAVRVFVPTLGPRIQLPTVAIPFVPVVAVAAVTLPPPVATAKVTLAPLTGLLFASFRMTLGAVATAVLVRAVWAFPAFTAIWVAGPAVVVMVPLVPLINSESVLAVKVYAVPATVPVVKVTVANPAPLVVLVADEKLPSVPVFDQVTVFPAGELHDMPPRSQIALMVTEVPATGALEVEVTR
jgi:hypothetical protein